MCHLSNDPLYSQKVVLWHRVHEEKTFGLETTLVRCSLLKGGLGKKVGIEEDTHSRVVILYFLDDKKRTKRDVIYRTYRLRKNDRR